MNKLTPEITADLKTKHGNELHLITVVECNKSCVIKQPGRKEITAATAAMKGNPVKFTESIIKNCFVWGDDPLEDPNDQDGYFLSVAGKIDDVIKVKDAEIKKL